MDQSAKEANIYRSLVEQHFKLLMTHYRISEDKHWQVLRAQIRTLYALLSYPYDSQASFAYDIHETIKLLVVSHWQLLRAEFEEPPAYLTLAIDEIERRSSTWFSYEREAWIDD